VGKTTITHPDGSKTVVQSSGGFAASFTEMKADLAMADLSVETP
jgi:hypothetical protein